MGWLLVGVWLGLFFCLELIIVVFCFVNLEICDNNFLWLGWEDIFVVLWVDVVGYGCCVFIFCMMNCVILFIVEFEIFFWIFFKLLIMYNMEGCLRWDDWMYLRVRFINCLRGLIFLGRFSFLFNSLFILFCLMSGMVYLWMYGGL